MKRPAKDSSRTEPVVSALAAEAEWDNEQLVLRALAGDPAAENAIFRQHVAPLLNLATRLTRSVAEGDDAVQDTFLVAFRKLDKLENPDAIRPWLIRILLSRIRKGARVRRLRAFFGFKAMEEDATLQMCAVYDARPDLRVELGRIDNILKKTPDTWRMTWMLHRIEGMSIQETAAATGRSASTVKRYVAAVDSRVRSFGRQTP